MKMKTLEYRGFNSTLDLRTADGNEWIFEGYAVTWNTIDDYRTTFKRGAFKKTISERGKHIKILWNHDSDEPIGKIVELREDDIGLFIRGLLTEGVTKAADVYHNLKAGVIDTLSFGFIPLQKKAADKDGVVCITEVKLYEISPVTFEANSTAVITDVRTKEDSSNQENKEGRSEDFGETVNESLLAKEGYLLFDALCETLQDIWWNNDDKEDIVSKQDKVIAEFHAAYLKWSSGYIDKFWSERKTALARNDLAKAFVLELKDSLEVMSSNTSFTIKEIKALSSGKILTKESRKKLVELPEPIRAAHQKERCKVVESLCDELRVGGFSVAESQRFSSLLRLRDIQKREDVLSFPNISNNIISELVKIRGSINQE